LLQADARFAQGDALTELGEHAAAILAFDEAARLAGESELAARARGRKGDCQFTLGADRPDRYREAAASFRAVMDSPSAGDDLRLQAEFKLGRTQEKLGAERRSEAFDHYLAVVYRWEALREQGRRPDAIWFTRAAFAAAALKEEDGRPREAAKIYERVSRAGVPAGEDARQRMEKLKASAGGG
jgi:tetratricopeptide (TPR) repeat protein